MDRGNLCLVLLLCLFCSVSIQAAVEVSSTSVCFGDTTRFTNQSNIPKTALVEWDLNNDGFFDDAVGETANRVYPRSDTFEIRVKITDSLGNEFFSASPHLVAVYPLPNAKFTVRDTCLGQRTSFVNTSTISDGTTLSYQWDFDNNTTIDATTLNALKQYNAAGSFTLKLKAISNQNCTSEFTRTLTIREKPVADFDFKASCAGNSSVFANKSIAGSGTLTQAVWNLGDGNLSFGQDSVLHTYTAAGNFNVKLSAVSNYGCLDSVTKSVPVNDKINYSFSFSNGQTFEQGKSTEVTVTGNFTSIAWTDNASADNPRTLSQAGDYTFMMSDAAGCSATENFSIQTTVPTDTTLQKANDFLTPNADGKNDVLYFVNLERYSNCTLNVYDTRGFEVFKSADYKNDWDGGNKNAGTYYYLLKCNGQDELKGHTNIIK